MASPRPQKIPFHMGFLVAYLLPFGAASNTVHNLRWSSRRPGSHILPDYMLTPVLLVLAGIELANLVAVFLYLRTRYGNYRPRTSTVYHFMSVSTLVAWLCSFLIPWPVDYLTDDPLLAGLIVYLRFHFLGIVCLRLAIQVGKLRLYGEALQSGDEFKIELAASDLKASEPDILDDVLKFFFVYLAPIFLAWQIHGHLLSLASNPSAELSSAAVWVLGAAHTIFLSGFVLDCIVRHSSYQVKARTVRIVQPLVLWAFLMVVSQSGPKAINYMIQDPFVGAVLAYVALTIYLRIFVHLVIDARKLEEVEERGGATGWFGTDDALEASYRDTKVVEDLL